MATLPASWARPSGASLRSRPLSCSLARRRPPPGEGRALLEPGFLDARRARSSSSAYGGPAISSSSGRRGRSLAVIVPEAPTAGQGAARHRRPGQRAGLLPPARPVIGEGSQRRAGQSLRSRRARTGLARRLDSLVRLARAVDPRCLVARDVLCAPGEGVAPAPGDTGPGELDQLLLDLLPGGWRRARTTPALQVEAPVAPFATPPWPCWLAPRRLVARVSARWLSRRDCTPHADRWRVEPGPAPRGAHGHGGGWAPTGGRRTGRRRHS